MSAPLAKARALVTGYHTRWSDQPFEVLAIDLRGHGGSAKQGKADLAPRVETTNQPLSRLRHPLPLGGGEGKGEGAVDSIPGFRGNTDFTSAWSA